MTTSAVSAAASPAESAPPKSNKYPSGIPYIVGNEAAERFSFYGMKGILFVHLAALLVNFQNEATLSAAQKASAEAHATAINHLFIAGVYAFPMIGAIAADRLVGKFRTIFWLSVVYCGGHAVLAGFDHLMLGMLVGLALIAIGAGGIKPCVSANVGDQFTRANSHLVKNVYLIFYFSINFGSFFATLIIPKLYSETGWLAGMSQMMRAKIAFGVPGVLMGLATLVFFFGRNKFVHVTPKPAGNLGLLDTISASLLFVPLGLFLFAEEMALPMRVGLGIVGFALGLVVFMIRQKKQWDDGFLGVIAYSLLNPDKKARSGGFFGVARERFGDSAAEGPPAVLRIALVFSMVAVFWTLFDQHSSTWIAQAKEMDLQVWGIHVEASQVQSLNPLMVMLLIPFLGLVVYPTLQKFGIEPTPLRRMTVGMLMAGFAFVAVAVIEARIAAAPAKSVTIGWQVLPYLIMTLSEVLVSATGLEFAYTQAPKRMKSTIMSFWLLTVSFGNKLTAVLAGLEGMERGKLFWTCAALMGAAAVVFGVLAYLYKGKTYMQDDADAESPAAQPETQAA